MKRNKPPKPSKAAERMRRFRKENTLHMRFLWRQAYWRKKGYDNYEGIGLGRMETPAEIRREVEELRTKIHEWNFQYYAWAAPTVSDAEYDRAFDRLKELEKKYPSIEDPTSPTRRVGAPLLATQDKVKHRVPMQSLDKAKSAKEVVGFFEGDYEGVVEPKIDGLSLAIKYVNGRMVEAITRGDGTEGENVTVNVRTIRTVPLRLRNRKLTLEVRGEVFMKWSDFDKHNQRLVAEGDQPAANPRNAATGALGLKHPAECSKVPLSFIAYQIIGPVEGLELERHTEALAELEEMGFLTSSALPRPVKEGMGMYQAGFKLGDLDAIAELIENLDKSRRLQDFPTDGLVFKVDDLKAQGEMGRGTTAPKWAVAFKYPPDQAKTRIKRIEWTVGKTGKVTPVAEFEPVLLSGSTVARASLCNADEIRRLGVNVGDDVLIEKSNEIIPKVIKVVDHRSKTVAPTPAKCPVCGADIKRFKDYVDVFCDNTRCPAQAEAKLVYAVSKSALDIDGCGPQAVSTFIQNGVVTLSQLLQSNCVFFKGATKTKLLAGIQKAMTAPLWRKLSALCVDSWGKQTCIQAATRFPSMVSLIDAFDNKQLSYVIGPDKAKEFGAFMQAQNTELMTLGEIGFFPETPEQPEEAGGLKGKSFCITGTLPGGVGRDEAEEQIRKRGGVTKGGVSRNLDYLVVGTAPGNTKLEGARRCGTACLTGEQLFEMLNWNPEVTVPKPIED